MAGGCFANIGNLCASAFNNGTIAASINDSGQIAETSTRSNAAQHAFLYANGAMTDIGIFEGGAGSYASAINAAGEIVGTAIDSRGIPHAFTYSGGKMQNLETLGGVVVYDSSAVAINASGQIVGSVGKVASPSFAFLFEDSSLKNLNDITNGLGAITLYSAYAITDAGLILTEGTDSARVAHLMVLTPTATASHARRRVAVGPNSADTVHRSRPRGSFEH